MITISAIHIVTKEGILNIMIMMKLDRTIVRYCTCTYTSCRKLTKSFSVSAFVTCSKLKDDEKNESTVHDDFSACRLYNDADRTDKLNLR
jgi:hypothetical protein